MDYRTTSRRKQKKTLADVAPPVGVFRVSEKQRVVSGTEFAKGANCSGACKIFPGLSNQITHMVARPPSLFTRAIPTLALERPGEAPSALQQVRRLHPARNNNNNNKTYTRPWRPAI